MAENDHFLSPEVERIRGILTTRGFRFCDESRSTVKVHEAKRYKQEQHAMQQVLQYAHQTPLEQLVLHGISATTTDRPEQGIDCVVDGDDETFWSSTGCHTANATDHLILRFAAGFCRLASVRIAAYRAIYQWGQPIYPAVTMSISVGASPWSQQTVVSEVPFLLTDRMQTILMPVDCPLGCYLTVTLHGRLQLQLEDHQYYTAIRTIEAVGTPCSPQQLVQVSHMLRQPAITGRTGMLPATVLPETDVPIQPLVGASAVVDDLQPGHLPHGLLVLNGQQYVENGHQQNVSSQEGNGSREVQNASSITENETREGKTGMVGEFVGIAGESGNVGQGESVRKRGTKSGGIGGWWGR